MTRVPLRRNCSSVAIRAARAGKHIILGKPMAMTVAQADEIE